MTDCTVRGRLNVDRSGAAALAAIAAGPGHAQPAFEECMQLMEVLNGVVEVLNPAKTRDEARSVLLADKDADPQIGHSGSIDLLIETATDTRN